MAVNTDGVARLERSVGIDAPIKHVWPALLDLERVVPCLPGAEISHVDEGGVHHGTFRIKLGPRSAVYRGTLRLEAVNISARTAVVAIASSERADRVFRATVVGKSVAGGRRTRLEVVTELPRAGRLGLLLGQSVIAERASEHLLREFATRLADAVNEPPPERAAPPTRTPRTTLAGTEARPVPRPFPATAGAAHARRRRHPAGAARAWARRARLDRPLNSLRRLVPIARAHTTRGWRERTCPTCLAASGQPCRTASGVTARRPHAARLLEPPVSRRRWRAFRRAVRR